MTRIAAVLAQLDDPSYRDVDGATLLDNTTVVIGTELGDDVVNHGLTDMPFWIAGGRGRFHAGELVIPGRSDVDFYNTILRGLGVSTPFGDPAVFPGVAAAVAGLTPASHGRHVALAAVRRGSRRCSHAIELRRGCSSFPWPARPSDVARQRAQASTPVPPWCMLRLYPGGGGTRTRCRRQQAARRNRRAAPGRLLRRRRAMDCGIMHRESSCQWIRAVRRRVSMRGHCSQTSLPVGSVLHRRGNVASFQPRRRLPTVPLEPAAGRRLALQSDPCRRVPLDRFRGGQQQNTNRRRDRVTARNARSPYGSGNSTWQSKSFHRRSRLRRCRRRRGSRTPLPAGRSCRRGRCRCRRGRIR